MSSEAAHEKNEWLNERPGELSKGPARQEIGVAFEPPHQVDTLARPGGASPEDLAPVFHDQFITLRINWLDNRQLELVDDALARMDSKDYGVCMDCGEPIPHRRLEAIPMGEPLHRLSGAFEPGL